MNEKPTYRFEIKSKTSGKEIRHTINQLVGFNGGNHTEEDIKMFAYGIVMGLSDYMSVYVEVYKLNDRGAYECIYTRL